MHQAPRSTVTDLPAYVPDKDEVKARLSLPYVCAKLGIPLLPNGTAPCPFHQDEHPSFYLWEGDDGYQRWWCQPCGFGGDIFDLIQRRLGLSFSEALDHAASLLAELPPGYEPPRRVSAPLRVGPDQWQVDVARARQRAAEPGQAGILSARCQLASIDDPALCARWDVYLRETWGWGIDEVGTIFMPHFAPDGMLIGCKLRDGSGKKQSLPGSRFEHLYGSWLGRRHKDVLITEGETDAVYAGWAAAAERIPLDVFALPSGASKPVETSWLAFLAGAHVYLALDPDAAGVQATRNWLEALHTAGFSEVRVCCLPLNRDLRAARPHLPSLLAVAQRPLREPDDVAAAPGGYVRSDRNANLRQVTTWTAEPTAKLTGDEGGYDVVFETRGTRKATVMRFTDLASVGALNKWANRHGTIFTGNDPDRQRIADLIQARGAITPEVFQTDRVGLHAPPATYSFAGPSVVYPRGYHGKLPWRYLPSARTADLTERVLLPTDAFQRVQWSWLEAFLALSNPSVMHPILSWLCASARRPEAARFPILFIGGSSGVGKSTLATLALRLMGSAIELSLGAATPFVLLRTLAGSASLPVFVDEWTRLGRRDVREAFQSAIPDLYSGGTIERGQADLSVNSYKVTAPTIVAGEDIFSLDRERERMVAVWPTRAAQNHDALARIAHVPLERFGALFHYWISLGPPDLPPLDSPAEDRVQHNADVLRAGWGTLLAFLDYAASYGDPVPVLPLVPDLSCFDREDEEDDENVYETAIIEAAALSDPNGLPVVWEDPVGRGTWVRTQALVGLLETRRFDIQLPGRSKAMLNYFRERYGVSSALVTPPLAMRTTRAHLIQGFHIPRPEEER